MGLDPAYGVGRWQESAKPAIPRTVVRNVVAAELHAM
jgi:hypothetical protein